MPLFSKTPASPPSVQQQQQAIQKEFQEKLSQERRRSWMRGRGMRLALIAVGLLGLVGVVVGVSSVQSRLVGSSDNQQQVNTPIQLSDLQIRVVSIEPVTQKESEKQFLYDVLVRVQNPQVDIAITEADYTVRLVNAQGTEIGRRTGTTVLPAQTEKGVAEFQVRSSEPAAKIDVQFTPIAFEQVDREIDIQTMVSDVVHVFEEDANENNRSVVRGEVRNDSSFRLQDVQLIIALYSETGRLVGLNATRVPSIARGATESFEARWATMVQSVDRVEVEVVTDPFSVGATLSDARRINVYDEMGSATQAH